MSSRAADTAAGSGKGDMTPTSKLILEEKEEKLSNKETTLRWYSEDDKLWVRKEIEVPHKSRNKSPTILKNPAPWSEESKRLASEENNLDWGELDDTLPVHKWIMDAIVRERQKEKYREEEQPGGKEDPEVRRRNMELWREVKRSVTLETVRREIQDSLDPEGTGRAKTKLKTLSNIVHKECLDKDKSAVMKKGGFQEDEKYGRKGRGRGDQKQVGKWNEFFGLKINAESSENKSSTSSSSSTKKRAPPSKQVEQEDKKSHTHGTSSSSCSSNQQETTTTLPSKGKDPLVTPNMMERRNKAQDARSRAQAYGADAKTAKSAASKIQLADLQKWKPRAEEVDETNKCGLGRGYPENFVSNSTNNSSAAADLEIWESHLQALQEELLSREAPAAGSGTTGTEIIPTTARTITAACRIEELKPFVENLRNRGGTHFAFEYEQFAIEQFLAEERRKEKTSSFLKTVYGVDERGNVLNKDHTTCNDELVNLVFKTEIQEHTDKRRQLVDALNINARQEKNSKSAGGAGTTTTVLTERERQAKQREKKELEDDFFRECPWYVVLDGGKPALKDSDYYSENRRGHTEAAKDIVLQDRRVALTSDYKLVTLSPKQVQGRRLLLALSAYHGFDLGYLEKRLNDFAKPEEEDQCLPYETCDCAALTRIYDQLTRFGEHRQDIDENGINKNTHKIMLRWDWFSHLFGLSNVNCRGLEDYIYVPVGQLDLLWETMKGTYDLLRIGLPIREKMRADGAFRFYFDFIINYKHSDPSLFLTEEEFLDPNCPLIIAMQHAVHAVFPTSGAYPCLIWRGSGFDRYQDMQCALRLRFVFPEVVCAYDANALKVRNYIVNFLDNECAREQDALADGKARGDVLLNSVPTPTCDFLKKLKDASSKGSLEVNDKKNLDFVKFILPDNDMEPKHGGYPTADGTIDMIWGDMALPSAAASQAMKQRCRNLVWRIDTEKVKKGSKKMKSKVGMMLQKPPDLDRVRVPTAEEQAATIKYYSFDEWISEHRIKNNFELYQKHFSIALKGKLQSEVNELKMRFDGPTKDTEAEHPLREMCKVPGKEMELTRKKMRRGRTGGGSD
ncbi:unnamed protein product [Amoebophrya sp. A120]|nr:unnamed protein product [Amoebophrya sp. A120]|eukprot:GSA120T00014803001.1